MYWSEDKQTRNLVSFDPANFEISKLYQRDFSPNAVWHSYFLKPWQSFYEKRTKSLEKIFSNSRNAIWSILLKYQEIDVQIQIFTDEGRNILHNCSFDGTYCQFIDYKY